MRQPILTLWGMYKYQPIILDNIELPVGMDREIMKDYIFMYAGENECRYGDPMLLSRLVNSWFRARKSEFGRMWYALTIAYNPIENTDRYEDYTRKFDSKESGNIKSETSGEGRNNSTHTPDLTTENQTSAFDSSAYQPRERTTESGNEKTEAETTSKAKGSQDTSNKREDKEEHSLHSHGNIGVTTNQQMIQSELELRQFDIYKYIAKCFEDEFTVPVYERRCNEYGLL